MSQIFTPTDEDLRLYHDRIATHLPERIIDIHSHLVPKDHFAEPSEERKRQLWPLSLPLTQTADEFLNNYDLLFPGKHLSAVLTFGLPTIESDIPAQNCYLLRTAKEHPTVQSLYIARPTEDENDFENALRNGHKGFKPYPDLAGSNRPGEEAIGEFLTEDMCAVADRNRAIIMLHISKFDRLADPNNTRDIRALVGRFPGMKLIIAHLGRSYTPHFLDVGLRELSDTDNFYFDFSAVTNPEVFRMAFERIDHSRIMFGLDLPVTLTRGYYEFPDEKTYRVHLQGRNLSQEYHPPLAYQILTGFFSAAESARLSQKSLDRIFHDNAHDLLGLDKVQMKNQ